MENKCKEKHIALFCLTDKSDSKIKTRGYQCVCLACDELVNIKEDITTMDNIVYRQTDLDPFMEYMSIVRNEYRNYIANGLSVIDTVNKLNSSNCNEEEKPKQFKKTTNN